MKLKSLGKVLLLGLATSALLAACSEQKVTSITGAGATFPYPIYSKWADTYQKSSGVSLNYQSVGSGAGIKQIKAKTVDFGASDMPLKEEELKEAGLVQFPVVMGGVVPVVNLKNVAPGELKLTGSVLADIYLGKITYWNAPEIAKLNPELKLPATAITVVHRADGSGTSFLWTDYLSKVSAEFKEKVGASTAVKWPTGVGGKGNEGVAANVQRLDGAIGYVEYAYAKSNKMPHAQMQNREGQFVQPTQTSFQAAAANADWAGTPGFGVVLTNQAGASSWPITGASFILLSATQPEAAKGKAILDFFNWSYKNGGAMASELDYVPMPDAVVALIQQVWKNQIKDGAGTAVWGSVRNFVCRGRVKNLSTSHW
ncbi:MAG: phosphate ABC transporter substrate-binding protein PstS [Burkholderiaceae bacterium]|nr:phosphate ABC transporter substrate-binding protein PstS [Burkholderiaceae bacterium]